ncbi:unnamed protein product [Effrenium voratum]|uniref:Uncharacterized protein n=1 Tax=Effrenium voratum TaxID=2562239 RepID=A0AA36NKC1_9DINO|nr:unnamed protein product [Effrenium voratum]CAJ1441990.1 unnamed protein product [Effrenium voratum]
MWPRKVNGIFQLPVYLEELMEELHGELLRPQAEEADATEGQQDANVETVVKAEDGKEEDPPAFRRASVFEAFVAAGFNWSVRRQKRRKGREQLCPDIEPQVVWKPDAKGGRPVSKRVEIKRKVVADLEPFAAAGAKTSRARRRRLRRPSPTEEETCPEPVLEVQGFELLGTEPLDTALNPWDFRDLRRSRPASRSPPSRPVTPVRVECPFLVRAVKPQDEGRTRSPLTQFVQRMNIDAECGEEWNDEDFKRQISDLKRQISFGRQISPVTGFGKFATRANRFVENPNSESFSRQTSNSRNGPDSYDNRLSAPASRADTREQYLRVAAEEEMVQAEQEGLPPAMEGTSTSTNSYAEAHSSSASAGDSQQMRHPATLARTDHSSQSRLEEPSRSQSLYQASNEGSDQAQVTEEPSVPPKLDARELEPDSREQSERLESQAEQLDWTRTNPSKESNPSEPSHEPAETAELLARCGSGWLRFQSGDTEKSAMPPVHRIGETWEEEEEEEDELVEPVAPVYLVPPWALRDHLRLNARTECRGVSPPLDRDLAEVVKSLEKAPALSGARPRRFSAVEPRPDERGRRPRRRLVTPVPDEPNAGARRPRPQSGGRALGTSLLSMMHPSRSSAKAQLDAQVQAVVNPRARRRTCSAAVQEDFSLLEPVTPDIGRSNTEPLDELSQCSGEALQDQPSFAEETFFFHFENGHLGAKDS